MAWPSAGAESPTRALNSSRWIQMPGVWPDGEPCCATDVLHRRSRNVPAGTPKEIQIMRNQRRHTFRSLRSTEPGGAATHPQEGLTTGMTGLKEAQGCVLCDGPVYWPRRSARVASAAARSRLGLVPPAQLLNARENALGVV
jgi:hypothetical protein